MKLAVILVVGCWASAAGAVEPVRQAGPQAPFWSRPCQTEVAGLCKSVAAGGVPACLAAHERQLSSGCASQFLWRYRLTQDCQTEIAACQGRDVPLSRCLKDDEKRLGDRCRAALLRGSQRGPAASKVARAARKGKR
jgi:hypothetical protein